ncbi:MAG TPA: hydroxymethylbilane synthase [Trebonia sp.]|nr:hydroxymethylbilane synthase [Trebonia sp.]
MIAFWAPDTDTDTDTDADADRRAYHAYARNAPTTSGKTSIPRSTPGGVPRGSYSGRRYLSQVTDGRQLGGRALQASSPGGRRSVSGSVGCVETVIVGARGSRLAQAMVQELITHLSGCPVVQFKARSVMTDGDKDRKTPLRSLGGGEGGVFTTQLEQELLAGRVDIAVHSLKDLPTAPPGGLSLAVTPPRADPLDALCGSTLEALRPGARVGTGSARRIAQLKALRPDVEVVPIRGNVPPRLAKLKSGLDAVILAASGLRRLALDDAITELLDPALFPPSPGQGALAVQVRASDRELLEMLNAFGDPDTDAAVRAERAVLGELHGGCSVPVGAYATRSGGVLTLSAQVTSLDGQRKVTGTVTGSAPETAGTELAAVLKQRGADTILDEIREPAGR